MECRPVMASDFNDEYAPGFTVRWFASQMTHIPHGNNVSFIEKIGPLPKGMCYDLDCDDFFRSGVFDFEAWQVDNDKPWFFECRSFCMRGLHKCGYAMFSEVLADGLELWLNGTRPKESGEPLEPAFIASLGGMKVALRGKPI